MYTTRIMFVSMLLELYCPLLKEAQKIGILFFRVQIFEMLDVKSEMSYPEWAYGKCKLSGFRSQYYRIIGGHEQKKLVSFVFVNL